MPCSLRKLFFNVFFSWILHFSLSAIFQPRQPHLRKQRQSSLLPTPTARTMSACLAFKLASSLEAASSGITTYQLRQACNMMKVQHCNTWLNSFEVLSIFPYLGYMSRMFVCSIPADASQHIFRSPITNRGSAIENRQGR